MTYFTSETDSGNLIKIPLKFRGYKITKPCGKGSFSSVVKVIDMQTNEKYAAKIIPKSGLKDKEKAINMINNEIEILQRANHPNIIQLYEIIELTTKDDSYTILIEEYCKKGNLLDYIITNGFENDQEKRQISLGITEAVRHLHSLGIAHCDIKPENVLLNSNKVPKLCDFNLSKFVQKESDSQRGGSKPYAAPELFKFQSVDFLRADIWSLGIMIYAISENRYPYSSVENAHQGLIILNTNDRKLIAFSKRCLKIDPLKRPTADELINDPYLTSNGEIENEKCDDDGEMIANKKEESVAKMKTSPNLADAKKIKKGEVTSNNNNSPQVSDDDGGDIDTEMAEYIFEMIYGYRRSSIQLDDSNDEVEDGYTEQTVYSRQRPSDMKSNNRPSHSKSKLEVTSSHHNNNNDDDDDDSSQNNHSGFNDDNDGLKVKSGSFAFSVMLEIGYDFELQSHSESSQADEVNDDDYEIMQQDDFTDYEIERIEDRICDSIVKFKYEKKRKPKKKGAHPKKKEKKDRKIDLDEE